MRFFCENLLATQLNGAALFSFIPSNEFSISKLHKFFPRRKKAHLKPFEKLPISASDNCQETKKNNIADEKGYQKEKNVHENVKNNFQSFFFEKANAF